MAESARPLAPDNGPADQDDSAPTPSAAELLPPAFRLLFDPHPDGLLVVERASGQIIAANAYAAVLLGRSQEALGGATLESLFGDGWRALNFATTAVAAMVAGPAAGTNGAEVTVSAAAFDGPEGAFALLTVRAAGEPAQVERQLRERLAARERETEALLEATRNLSENIALGPLVTSLLDHLNGVIDCQGASLAVFDTPGRMRVLEARRFEPGLPSVISASPGMEVDLPTGDPVWAPFFRHEPIVVADVREDSERAHSIRKPWTDVSAERGAHIRAWMAFPLVVSGSIAGMLTVARSRPNSFEPDDVALVRAFAAQAAAALANAGLFEQLRQQALRNETLAQVAARFSVGDDLSRTLSQVCQLVVEATGAVAADVVAPDGFDEERVTAWAFGGYGHLPGYLEICQRLVAEGASTPMFRVMETQATRVYHNARESIRATPDWADLWPYLERTRWDTMAAVPVVYRERSIGTISVFFAPDGHVDDEVLGFLRAIADQAAVGIENARLFEDARRSAREYATLAGIAADLTLDRPMDDALTAICASVARGTGAIASTIAFLDSAANELFARGSFGIPAGQLEKVRRTRIMHPAERRWLFEEGKPVTVAPLREEAERFPGLAPLAPFLLESGVNSVVLLPVFVRGGPIGTLNLMLAAATPPAANTLRFYAAIANQVAAAIDNKQLYEQMERSARESSALAAVAANITLGQPVRSTLDTVATSVILATSALTCTVSVADPETGYLQMAGAAGVPEGFVEIAREIANRPGSQRNLAVERGAPVVQKNARATLLAEPAFAGIHEAIRQAPWDTVVSLPVSYGGRYVGVLQVGYEGDKEPRGEEWRLLSAMADQLAVAIENAGLYFRSERNARENAALAEIARNVALDQPMRDTLSEISRNVVAATAAMGTALFLVDTRSDRIIMSGSHGITPALIRMIEETVPASSGFTVEAFRDGSQIFIDDARRKILNNPVFAPVHAMMETEPWEHIQVVPVMYRGKPVGALYLAYEGARVPSPDEHHLLDAIANQVAVAIENVRLFQETEARTMELSSLLDLARSAGSTLAMEPLIAGVLMRLREVLACSGVAISSFDDDGWITLIGQDADPGLRNDLGLRVRHGEGTALGERLHAGKPVIIEDLWDGSAVSTALLSKVGESEKEVWARIRAWMAVPLVSKGKTIGAMFFSDREPRRFGQREADLALAFAAYATAAMENARAFEERDQRVRELEALQNIAASLTAVQPLNEILQTLVESFVESTEAVACSANLLDEHGAIAYLAQHGLPEGYGEALQRVYRENARAREVALRFPIENQGAPFFGRREDLLATRGYGAAHETISRSNYDRYVMMPLRYQERAFGSLNAYYAPGHEPEESEVALLRAISDQAAVAVENGRLFAATERRAHQQAALAAIGTVLTYDQPLPALLNVLSESVVQHTGAEGASVVLFDEHSNTAEFGGFGLPEGYVEGLVSGRTLHPDRWYMPDRSTEPSVLEHARDYVMNIGASPVAPMMDGVTWDCVVRVPFVYRERTRGLLSVYVAGSLRPPDEQIEFFKAIADRSSIAIESARLFADIERRAREQAALASISSALSYDRPIGEVLNALAQTVVAETDAAGVAVVVYQGAARPVASGIAGLPPGYLSAIGESRRRDPVFWDAMEAATSPVVIDQAARRIATEPQWQELQRFGQLTWDSVVRIPFSFRERTRGMLNLFLPQSEAPSEADMAFYQTIADRTSVAVDNATLFSEVQSRTQELTALYRADEELHRSLQIDDVLTSLLGLVVDLLRVDGAAIQLWEPGASEPRLLTSGYTTAVAAERVVNSLREEGREAFVRSVLERVENALAIEETEGDPRAVQNRTATIGIHSVLDIGLMASDEVFGKLTAYNLKQRRFNAEDRRLFTALSRRAALAIENARLFGQAQERTQQLAALYRADEELHRSLQLDDVLLGLISTVRDTFAADLVATVVWEEGELRPRSLPDLPEYGERAEHAVESMVRMGRDAYIAARSGVRVLEDSAEAPEESRPRNFDLGVRAVIEAPLRANGKVIGHIGVAYRQPRRFSTEEQRLLGALARRAEVAIDNARLYGQAQALAAVEERQRLARELHDSVSQALYGIALGARTARTLLDRDATKAVEPVDYVLSLAEAGLAEMRALIFELRPESLEQEGLVAAIEKQVASTRARYGVAVDADLGEEPDLPLAMKEGLYRVAQEALHNVVKHARATTVRVSLSATDSEAVLDLSDDGIGFDPGGEYPGHLGLRSMRERVTRLGGRFTIESEPGEGSHLRAEIPLA